MSSTQSQKHPALTIMANPGPSGPSEDDDWDEYLHGMFKKLKMDPEKVKDDATFATPLSKPGSCWYNRTVKTPKKTRKSLALRSSRNRLSPYRSLVTFHAGKATCESPLIRSSALLTASEQGNRLGHSKMWSDAGNVKVKFAKGIGKCSCSKRDMTCSCAKEGESHCKCRKKDPECHFGSMCKSKLLTFRTLATIVEESGEVVVKEKRSEKKLFAAATPCKERATSDVLGEKSRAPGATAVPHFSNYRNSAARFDLPPKISSSALPTSTPYTAQSSSLPVGSTSRKSNLPSRAPARPEYSCSQEARMAIDGLPDDTSVNDLAGYFDSIVYIPRKMSAMAEMMYT